MSLSRRSRRITSKATGEWRRRWDKALLIAASLATVLAAAPALAQETATTPAGALEAPGATPYQYYAPATTGDAPGAGHQGGELGSGLTLEVIPSEPAPDQQADPGQPPGGVLEDPGDVREGSSPGDPTGNQNLAQQAAQEAQGAAQAAQLAASDAQEAISTVQRSSAPAEDVQVAQEAAQEAQLAASDAQEAAEDAQQAATREDVSAAQESAQEAQEAAQEAQQTSSAIQQVAQQVAQQAVENFGDTGDLKNAYARALQVARSAGGEGDNRALAAESDPEKEAEADPEKASSSSEGTSVKAANGKGARKGSTGEATEPEEDVEETRSDTAVATTPTQGGLPLLLGGGVVLAAGAAFVVRKIIWS